MDESLEIISRLWSEEHVTFSGRHFQLDRASIAPRPVQKPLPLWVGGAAEAAIERTARWGTGWQAGIETAAEVAPVIAAIKQRADELGTTDRRRPLRRRLRLSLRPPRRSDQREVPERPQRAPGGKPADDYVAIGDADTIMARVDEFRRAGVHKFVLRPIAFGTDEMLSQTRSLIENGVAAHRGSESSLATSRVNESALSPARRSRGSTSGSPSVR